MVLCGLLTWVLVPATLPRVRPRRPARSLRLPGLSTAVQRYHVPILVIAGIATVLLGAASTRLHINPTLDRLKSVTPAAVLEEKLAPMFGLPGDVYVVLDRGPDLQALLASNERLAHDLSRTSPDVRFQPATTLLPSEAAQVHRAAVVAASGLTAGGVERDLARAANAAGFRPGSFDPFRDRVPRLLDSSQRLTYDGYRSHGLGDLLDRFIARTPEGWLLASYAFPAGDAQVAALEHAVAAADSTATLTGLPLVNRELSDRFLPQFIRGLSIGALIVIVIVVWAFRDWWL
jgi:hypothetical protein